MTLARIAFAAAVAATVGFAAAAAWGMTGVIGGGHYASVGAMGIAAENMLQWHVWGPVPDYLGRAPLPAEYYCHHPFGVFWVLVPLIGIFGHHDWVLYVPAVVMSSLMPPMLYGIGKHIGGPLAGAAAACGFVVVPISLGFANFSSLEVMVLFGTVLFFWGHARFTATARRRYLVLSLLGVLVATAGDWPGYIAVGVVLGVSLVRSQLLPSKWSPPSSAKTSSTWWSLSAAVAVASLLLWVAFFIQAGKLGEWLGSASSRSSGSEGSLSSVLASRKHWIELMFTPLAIAIGKLALPVAVARLVIRRRDEEAYSLAILVAATVQYVAFKQGADVHIFWPHYFAGYFALAFAQVVATVDRGVRAAVASPYFARFAHAPLAASAVTLACTFVPVASMLPDGLRTLRYGRASGGRYDERGWPTPSDSDIVLLLHRLRETMPTTATLEGHSSTQWGWYHAWAWGRASQGTGSLPATIEASNAPRLFLARGSWLSVDQQKALADAFHVQVFGEIWLIDKSAPHAPIDAFSFAEREPNIWQWFWHGGTEPIRTIVSDPYATWEWRTHFGQPAEPPGVPPATLEQKRIAHNIAVARGDSDKASQLFGDIQAELGPPSSAFSEGITLIGTRRIEGTQPRIETWFRASEPVKADGTWTVRTLLIDKKAWSLIPPDTKEREISRPIWPTTSLWKPGFVYRHTAVLWHRIGVERFSGLFTPHTGASLAPARTDGAPSTVLLVEP